MARVKRSVTARARHKEMIAKASGHRGRRSSCFRVAIESVEKALRYAYRDRRNKKRDARGLWIQRINAAARQHGLSYSTFMHGLKLANVEVDRKVLAHIAIEDTGAFAQYAKKAQESLKTARA